MKSKAASVDDLRRAKKIINRIHDLESFVFFPALSEIKTWSLYVYTDASHANLPDGVRSSAMGCLVFVVGQGVALCAVSWRDSKMERVVRSMFGSSDYGLAGGIGGSCLYLKFNF